MVPLFGESPMDVEEKYGSNYISSFPTSLPVMILK